MGQVTELFVDPSTLARAFPVAAAERKLRAETVTEPKTCECQQCAADSHEDESTSCSADAEFSVTHSGFSCAECLAMMVTMGLSMAEDDPDADAEAPLTVTVGAF